MAEIQKDQLELTITEPNRRRKRRPSTGERTLCSREGGGRVVPRKRLETCSLMCEVVVTELAEAQRVCAVAGALCMAGSRREGYRWPPPPWKPPWKPKPPIANSSPP